MQFAAAGHAKHVRIVAVLHPQRDVGQQLPVQALAQLAGGQELPVAAGERRLVDLEIHGDGGFVHRQRRQASGRSGSHSVSEMARPSMPVTATMSPAEACSTS